MTSALRSRPAWRRRSAFVGALIAGASLSALPGSAGAASSTRALRLSPASADPQNFALGPEGDLWLTQFATDSLTRIAPNGKLNTLALGLSGARGIVYGPLGRFWISSPGVILSVTPTGEMQRYEYGEAIGIAVSTNGPQDLTVGAEGNIYFIVPGSSYAVWRLEPKTGAYAPFVQLPASYTTPAIVAAGSHGLWLAADGAPNLANLREIHRSALIEVSYGGTISEHPLRRNEIPGAAVAASNNQLWFADGAELLRVQAATGAVSQIRIPAAVIKLGRGKLFKIHPGAEQLAAGPRGEVWFTDSDEVLGERTAAGHFLFWKINRGTSTGLVALPGNRVYIAYANPAQVVVHR